MKLLIYIVDLWIIKYTLEPFICKFSGERVYQVLL